MKTITCNRYSYNFYKAEGQPIVEWCIEGELKQVVRVTAEAGNEFFVHLSKLDRRSCMMKVIDKMADHAFVQMFIACERLNSRRGQCKIEQAPLSEEPEVYKVIIVSAGGVKHDLLFDMTEDEATRYCEENGWTYLDSNQFEWGLDVARQY